ncbi:Integrator complex subunit 12 [Operophtera brumata]|uniref:Integrator complex subunit 12 n=1 Tax=Operophtera brumata TaxID=104452 RepID=A0A0L7KZT8_OPEBR|nr:Integrator complex subunit 12 [Operophtera brumata]
MSSIDFDPSIKLCLKYLHSGASDSTEQLRLTLDEHIRQAYGSSKTLGNVLPKKYLNEEKMESARSKHKIEKSKTVPVSQPSPQQIQIPERDDDDGLVMDGELAFDLLEEDLTCTNHDGGERDYARLRLGLARRCDSCLFGIICCESGRGKSVKLERLPEYLRDTVDWFMG